MLETNMITNEEAGFVERRSGVRSGSPNGLERRQFASTHQDLSPEARELAQAVDSYKLRHRRRFVNFEEILAIVRELGYSRS
ncbi:MAG: hypothetical protein U0795_01195 [Pirellulales bacterium]